MLRNAATAAAATATMIRRRSTVATVVNSMLLRSLKEHYLEVSKMAPPPKVSPPEPFTIVKGALESEGPVLKRSYKNEEISIYVMRLANLTPGAEEGGAGDEDDGINQLFIHVDVAKPDQEDSLHFLCGLYPDALGIHSVTLRPSLEKSGFLAAAKKYNGPEFEDLDERIRDKFHDYILERGINESLFPFLQAWLYVKDHKNLMRWFKSVGTFLNASAN
ncbi:hypothetical protein Droror1_Dr00009746 [Drosera rotundifolia]